MHVARRITKYGIGLAPSRAFRNWFTCLKCCGADASVITTISGISHIPSKSKLSTYEMPLGPSSRNEQSIVSCQNVSPSFLRRQRPNSSELSTIIVPLVIKPAGIASLYIVVDN